jgi:hypothetical protein
MTRLTVTRVEPIDHYRSPEPIDHYYSSRGRRAPAMHPPRRVGSGSGTREEEAGGRLPVMLCLDTLARGAALVRRGAT